MNIFKISVHAKFLMLKCHGLCGYVDGKGCVDVTHKQSLLKDPLRATASQRDRIGL
jgi:hypothetical protein